MSDYKKNGLAPDHRDATHATANGNGDGDARAGYESTLKNGRVRGLVAPTGQDIGGWDSYHRWLSRVQSPNKCRADMDPGLYTWKGYRNWSEKIRRDWKQHE
ncbi:MAG: hypothetical protein FJ197_06690 [Gammaproteobacteria bacterium]|nr:hypothetical protein [Gammaproteobacteria bacterium]